MIMCPAGVITVDADNDLYALNDRITVGGMKNYGKIITLMGEIDECIVVLDFPCPVPYVFAGGVIYANLVGANLDLFDLDNALPPYTWYTETYYDHEGKPLIPEIPPVNPAIRTVVHNYAWTGYPSAFFAEHTPTIVVGAEQAAHFGRDPMNQKYMDYALVSGDLRAAMDFAYRATKTDKVMIFDGAAGGINVSRSLAELLTNRAPEVSDRVDKLLMPKWLEQRSVDVKLLGRVA
jgi:hypothetical protein